MVEPKKRKRSLAPKAEVAQQATAEAKVTVGAHEEIAKVAEEKPDLPKVAQKKGLTPLEQACVAFGITKLSDVLAFNDHGTEYHLITTNGQKFIMPK